MEFRLTYAGPLLGAQACYSLLTQPPRFPAVAGMGLADASAEYDRRSSATGGTMLSQQNISAATPTGASPIYASEKYMMDLSFLLFPHCL